MKKILVGLLLICTALTMACGRNTKNVNISGQKMHSDYVDSILMSKIDGEWTIELNSVCLTDAYAVVVVTFCNGNNDIASDYIVSVTATMNGESFGNDSGMMQQARETNRIQQEILLAYNKNYPDVNNDVNLEITLMKATDNKLENTARCEFNIENLQYVKSSEISNKVNLHLRKSDTLSDFCLRRDNGYISASYSGDLSDNEDYFVYANDEQSNEYIFTYTGNNVDGENIMKGWRMNKSGLTELKEIPVNCQKIRVSIYKMSNMTSKQMSDESILEITDSLNK